MEPDRRAKLKSYAWLTTLAMLLALFVPLASVGAQEEPQEEPPAGQTAEEGGTLDATPESATNRVDEAHEIHASLGDSDDAADNDGESIVAEVDETSPGVSPDSTYGGGLPPEARDECTAQDPEEEGHAAHCDLTFEEPAAPGKDRIRVFHDANGDGEWNQDEDYDFVTKTWVGLNDEGDTERLGGGDRIETAVEISRDVWSDQDEAGTNAERVVIARADDFPDALAGTPLAVLVDGPLLLTFPDSLDERTETELERVLAPDDDEDVDVYLLGEVHAISLAVEARIQELGYETERLGGGDRFETAVDIAGEIEEQQGEPVEHIFIARSHEFPDSLAAGAAAAHVGENPVAADDEPVTGTVGAILLTNDGNRHPVTEAFIEQRTRDEDAEQNGTEEDDRPDATTYALASELYNPWSCDESAEGETAHTKNDCEGEDDADFALWGFDRHGTARAIAEFFFDAPDELGIARSDLFPDALTGGAHIGRFGGPIVLTPTHSLHPEAERYLCYEADAAETAFVYGEVAAISDPVEAEVAAAIRGENCPDFLDPGHHAVQTQTTE